MRARRPSMRALRSGRLTVALLFAVVLAACGSDEPDSPPAAPATTEAPAPAEARGIVTEVEVTSGQETAHSICSAAERFGADIVCLGSHTRHGFSDKKLGSVPLAVLQSCRRPTLVVWPPAE